jgi:hypothetical protein
MDSRIAASAERLGAETQLPAVSAVSWGAIIAGAVVAVATAFILITLGAGIGVASVSPWPHRGVSPTTFTVAATIWLVVVQWLASAAGGYITGRLRVRWVHVHTHEVFFRDTANGFISWALATLIGASLLGLMASSASITAAAGALGGPEAAVQDSAYIALVSALSMIIGAFITCIAAALGGHVRDEHF